MQILKKSQSFLAKISPKKWFILCIFILILVQIIIYPGILKTTFFHAEDGTVFFSNAKNGLEALFTPWGGYLVLLSRIITGIAYVIMLITNSILAAGETIEILSIITVALICAYFASDTFSYLIASRPKRLVLMTVLILLMSGFENMLYNTVDLHWWCGIFALFVSLNLIHNKKLSNWAVLFTILCILSSPSTFYIIFPCIYSIKKYSFKTNKALYLTIIISILIQAIVVFFVPTQTVLGVVDSNRGPQSILNYDSIIKNLPTTVYNIIITLALMPYYTLGSSFPYILEQQLYGPAVFLGIVLWTSLIFYHRKSPTQLRQILLCIIAICTIYAMVSLKGSFPDYTSSFYHSTCTAIAFITFGVQICNLKNLKLLPYLLAPPLTLVLILSIFEIDLSPNQDLILVDNYIDRNSNHTARVFIKPNEGIWKERWYVDVPVEESYCKSHICLDNNTTKGTP